MGGTPLTAFTVVCFPQDADLDVLGQIMRGGMSKMGEAGCTIVGGHSVRDAEIKFGYAVTGTIHQRVYGSTEAHVPETACC
jgi:selenide, water dikinase